MNELHVDGNALGGLLFEVFGREMTDQHGCCDACGSIGPLGRTIVFRNAPGDVMRCADCGAVLMVAVHFESGTRIAIKSLRWIEFVG